MKIVFTPIYFFNVSKNYLKTTLLKNHYYTEIVAYISQISTKAACDIELNITFWSRKTEIVLSCETYSECFIYNIEQKKDHC